MIEIGVRGHNIYTEEIWNSEVNTPLKSIIMFPLSMPNFTTNHSLKNTNKKN